MDFSIAEGINDWANGSRLVEALSELLAQDGVFLLVGGLALLFFATGRWRSVAGRRGASAAGFSAVVALGLGQLISHAADRARPFVDHPQIHLLIQHARDAGFPSDHATGAFAISTALLLRHRRAGAAAMIVAALIAVGRVAVGAHYPGDVLGGAALGAAVALLLWARPLRTITDRIGDLAGLLYERALAALTNGRLGPSSSPTG